MVRISYLLIFLVALFSPPSCAYSTEPTARTFVFAYYKLGEHPQSIDTLARHFDLIVFNDRWRNWNVKLRDNKKGLWRRGKKPLTLVYKDALTIKGPGSPPLYDSACFDSSAGGGTTVGGFWYFDAMFFGRGFHRDTSFMMATISPRYPPPCTTANKDRYGRVQSGEPPQYKYRWAMDYRDSLWRYFYACTSKVQCLRNYANMAYDSTYFDGVFIDNLLNFVDGLGYGYHTYPEQYYDANLARWDANLREAVDIFMGTVSNEYRNPSTPAGHPRRIMAVGNTNRTHMAVKEYTGLWKKNLQYLDGVMEESDFARSDIPYNRWQRMIDEMMIAESLGKICLVHKSCAAVTGISPLSVANYDSVQMLYGFASYLMAYDSTCYFAFSQSGDYAHIYWANIMDINLGKPMGRYSEHFSAKDSFACRYYEKGVVFVNPTFTQAIAGFPGDTLLEIDVSGGIKDTLIGKFILDHHNGKICLYP